jgi:hypothetical protein
VPKEHDFKEFNQFLEERGVSEVRELLISVALDYGVKIAESVAEGVKCPFAARNLRFLNDLIFELDCLLEDTK